MIKKGTLSPTSIDCLWETVQPWEEKSVIYYYLEHHNSISLEMINQLQISLTFLSLRQVKLWGFIDLSNIATELFKSSHTSVHTSTLS